MQLWSHHKTCIRTPEEQGCGLSGTRYTENERSREPASSMRPRGENSSCVTVSVCAPDNCATARQLAVSHTQIVAVAVVCGHPL